MICGNCQNVAVHIFSTDGRDHCENCSEISSTSGTKTDGILARTSFRVRRQQAQHEGDMVLPHLYDKSSHRETVNPDFVKLYPDKVKDYFSAEQLAKDGYKKMPAYIQKKETSRELAKQKYKSDTIYAGSSQKAIGNYLKETDPTL